MLFTPRRYACRVLIIRKHDPLGGIGSGVFPRTRRHLTRSGRTGERRSAQSCARTVTFRRGRAPAGRPSEAVRRAGCVVCGRMWAESRRRSAPVNRSLTAGGLPRRRPEPFDALGSKRSGPLLRRRALHSLKAFPSADMSLQRTTPRRISARMWAAALAWGLAVLASVIYVASSLIHHPPRATSGGSSPTREAAGFRALSRGLARRHGNTLTLFVSRPEAKDRKVRGGAPVDLQAEARKLAKVLDEGLKLEPRSGAPPRRTRAGSKAAARKRPKPDDACRRSPVRRHVAEALGRFGAFVAASPVAGASFLATIPNGSRRVGRQAPRDLALDGALWRRAPPARCSRAVSPTSSPCSLKRGSHPWRARAAPGRRRGTRNDCPCGLPLGWRSW